MKRNKFFMLGIVTVLVAVLSLTFVSNTFAKYTSTVTGQDTARVAKWDFTISDTSIELDGSEPQIVFDLFNTIYEADGVTTESDVKVGSGETIIAPGTGGSFTLSFKNASEVNATYAVAFTVTNEAGIPLEFNVNNQGWKSSLDSVAATNIIMGGTGEVVVKWRWAFNGNDSTDTALGIKGTDKITVKADLTFTQVD